jgi:hypothetical protein
MVSGNNQRYPPLRALVPGAVFAHALFLEPPVMVPTRPVVQASHFLVRRVQTMPAANRSPAPRPLTLMAPAPFGLPPQPPLAPPSNLVGGVRGVIEMVPLEPNHAFWAPYRSNGSRPVELDFMGVLGGAAGSATVSDPGDNIPGPRSSSSPSFKYWIEQKCVSSAHMEAESSME